MLSRKPKHVAHPQWQRNALADGRSLTGSGWKSWNSLAKALLATETSPFLPLVTLCPTWTGRVSSLWVSPLGGIRRCQKPVPDLGSPAAPLLLWPGLQMLCPARHSRVAEGSCEIACVCRCVGGEGGGTESGRELDLGHGCVLERQQVSSFCFVCSSSLSSCMAWLCVSSRCFRFSVIQFYFSFRNSL